MSTKKPNMFSSAMKKAKSLLTGKEFSRNIETRSIEFVETEIDLGEVKPEPTEIIFKFEGNPSNIHAWVVDCGCTGIHKTDDSIVLNYTPPTFEKLVSGYGKKANAESITKNMKSSYPKGYYEFQKGAWVTDKENNKHRLVFKGKVKLPEDIESAVKALKS